jgi:hypothetical protein
MSWLARYFDHHGAALLHQPHGVVERLLGRRVAHERHIDHEEGTPEAPRHATAVIDHLVDGHGHRGIETLNDHAEAIADEDDVGARKIDELREARVVRGKARDRLARLLHVTQRADVHGRRFHAALLQLLVHVDLCPSTSRPAAHRPD